MEIIVLADDSSKEEFLQKKIPDNILVIFAENFSDLLNNSSAAAIFILQETGTTDLKKLNKKPVFISSTIQTLKAPGLPKNFTRFNGWPGFLKREIWDIATNDEGSVKQIFGLLGWKYAIVADEPGLVAARIISMIINEAYFALGENVSTRDEIDIAMKLGTNYPYGPFEWCQKIGIKNIYSLLKKLGEKDSRYTVSPAMETAVKNI